LVNNLLTGNAPPHLSPDELAKILQSIESSDAVLIGGQAVNVWAFHYLPKIPELQKLGPFTSKDIDFYGSAKAAQELAKKIGGTVFIPDIDDNTPNSAQVVANMSNREVCIDFMANVLGVKDAQINNRVVTLEGSLGTDGPRVGIVLLHPVDCLKSKLANINILDRQDIYAISQTQTSILICSGLIDELLETGDFRRAQKILNEIFYITKNDCIRSRAYTDHKLDSSQILDNFEYDVRLDARWRKFILSKHIEKIRKFKK
tara:strand:+ start:436 stop:1215 length:780 start_codon:yes stop_codon:yes gene_type:complete